MQVNAKNLIKIGLGILGLFVFMGLVAASSSVNSGNGPTKLIHYAYPGDPSLDRYSKHGIGDRNNHLEAGYSVALTRAERLARFGINGSSTGKIFSYAGKVYRDDDTAPQSDRRIDIYDPGNQYPQLAKGGIVSPPHVRLDG
jgi:hypothetical protein